MENKKAIESIKWHISQTEIRILVNLEQEEALKKQRVRLNEDLDLMIQELNKYNKQEESQ